MRIKGRLNIRHEDPRMAKLGQSTEMRYKAHWKNLEKSGKILKEDRLSFSLAITFSSVTFSTSELG